MLPGVTAAKRMLVMYWQSPKFLTYSHETNLPLNIIHMGRSIAKIRGVSKETLDALQMNELIY